MNTAAITAPAKLNLFLNITGRRENGYHELQTVFQLLDFGDTLNVSLREDGLIRLLDGVAGVDEADNLISRAARLLQQYTGCTLGADIGVDKCIPQGGGLGGGSSDAASTLLLLNRLWRTELDPDTLAALGLQLGADVPVFVHGRTAWAEGIGERLQPLDLPERWYLVARPFCNVSTAEVFGDPQLTRHNSPIKIAAFLERGAGNVCEPVVRKRYPAVDRAWQWLNQHAPAQLTGTGACLFAAFDDRQRASAVLSERPAGLECFIAQGVNHSPAHRALQRL